MVYDDDGRDETMRLLLAEDEIAMSEAVVDILNYHKYSVDAVYDGEDALYYARSQSYDGIILDVMMPKLDGLSVLRQLRRENNITPVLLLTARAEVEDRIGGLDAGADDYLPKPFAMGEFISRVRALTRRSGNYAPDIIRVGDTTLDLSSYTLSANSQSVRLNNKEFQLMELFMRNRGRVFSTDALMQKVWDLDTESETDVVWTYIGFLRKKLRGLDADVEIKTIRGAGYALEEK